MHRPKPGDENGGPKLADKPQRHGERKEDIAAVQNEIDPVIAFGMIPVSEPCIVEEQGQNRQRAVKAGFHYWPPIGMAEDQPDVLGSSFVDLFLLKQNAVIERKLRMKRI